MPYYCNGKEAQAGDVIQYVDPETKKVSVGLVVKTNNVDRVNLQVIPLPEDAMTTVASAETALLHDGLPSQLMPQENQSAE